MNKRLGSLSLAAIAAGVVLSGSPHTTPTLAAYVTPAACDGSVVTASINGRDGVAVFVHGSGPDVVQVDVNSQIKSDHRHLVQQVTKRGVGAEFDFDRLSAIRSIIVNTRRDGVCAAPIPTPIW